MVDAGLTPDEVVNRLPSAIKSLLRPCTSPILDVTELDISSPILAVPSICQPASETGPVTRILFPPAALKSFFSIT